MRAGKGGRWRAGLVTIAPRTFRVCVDTAPRWAGILRPKRDVVIWTPASPTITGGNSAQ